MKINLNEYKYKLIICIIFIFLGAGFISYYESQQIIKKEDNLLKNKTFVVKTNQYHTLYKDEKLDFDIYIFDSNQILNKDMLCWLIDEDGEEQEIDEWKLEVNNEIGKNKYKAYKLSLEVSTIKSSKRIFNKICIQSDNNLTEYDIGNIIVEDTQLDQNTNIKNVDILATMTSIDGVSYSVIIQNNTNEKLEVTNIYYKLKQVNEEKEEISSDLENTENIMPNEEKDIRLFLNQKFSNQNVCFRPIIEFKYEGKKYEMLTHTYIKFFDDIITKKEILNQILMEKVE